MTTVVDVCNMALAQLGKAEIASLDEHSAPAAWCRRAYDVARKDALARSDWVFARGAVGAVGVQTLDHPQFNYAYARPADFVKMRSFGAQGTLYSRSGSQPYELAGPVIYGIHPTAVIYYTRDIPDPDNWPMPFTEAVAFKMASLMAMQATGRSDAAVNLQKLYENQLMLAVESDAAQERTTWTGSEETEIEHLPHEAWPDFPYDQTMLWGTTGVGTPVSEGGGAPPSEVVTIYEEGAGVDTDYVNIYDPNGVPGDGDTGGTDTDYTDIYNTARTT